MIEKKNFQSNIDWLTYKITGKLPEYLKKESKKKWNIYYKPHPTTEDRGTVIISEAGKRSVCSCYEKEFPMIQDKLMMEYDGSNFAELKQKYSKKYNLKRKNCRKNRIMKLEDCNIHFNQRKGDSRVDAHTYLRGKNYAICRCYPEEVSSVRRDFNRMKKQKRATVESIHDKLSGKYNLKTRALKNAPKKGMFRLDNGNYILEVTRDGMVYRDGKFINNLNQLLENA